MPRLVAACPSFTLKWEQYTREYVDEEDYLPYVALCEFNNHIFELYTSGSIEEFSSVFAEIERLHLEGEPYVKEAATIGCLEGLQNIMGNRGMDADVLLPFLGPESRKWWDQLNKFLNGEISYIGETRDRGVHMKTIGLIGGISWESTVTYYQVINRRVKDLLGGAHSARVLLNSVDFDEVSRMQHAGRWDDFQELLIDSAKKLERGGADFFLICANTPHIVADGVEKAVGIPLVHIGDAVGETIRTAGMTKVGLLGTRFTMEKDFLKNRLRDKFGIESIVPEKEDRNIVHSVIYNELVNGDIRDGSRNEYLRIIDKLTAAGAEGIILGCTEIPLLVTSADTDAALFDTATIHAERAVDLALERTDAANQISAVV